MNDTTTFSIHIIGDTTGKTWAGEFKSRRFLSSRQQLERDRVLRSLLGSDPQFSLQIDRAAKLADLHVGVTESPEFWKESAGGLDLVDDNLLEAVHEHVMAGQKEARDALLKKKEAAKEALKEDLKKPAEEE